MNIVIFCVALSLVGKATAFYTCECLLQMSENVQSAFSMYATKRKSTEKPVNSKKRKNNHSRGNDAINQKSVPEVLSIEEIWKRQQRKRKCTLNVAMKSKTGIVTKAGNLRVVRHTKKAQSIQKENKQGKTQQLNKIKDVQSIHKKSKLKNKKMKSKIEKKKNKMNECNKNKIKDSPTVNHEKQDSDNCKGTKYDEILDNPVVMSHKLFEWLIFPLKVEDFFA